MRNENILPTNPNILLASLTFKCCRVQRGDLMEVSQHEAALVKLRQEMAAEQVAAVTEATARERRRLETELDRERARLMRQEAAKQVGYVI